MPGQNRNGENHVNGTERNDEHSFGDYNGETFLTSTVVALIHEV